MNHVHSHGEQLPLSGELQRRIGGAALANLALAGAEVAIAMRTGSLALVSDMLHNTGDFLAYGARWQAARSEEGGRMRRSLRAMANLAVMSSTFYIGYRAGTSLPDPGTIEGGSMAVAGAVAAGLTNYKVARWIEAAPATTEGDRDLQEDAVAHAKADMLSSGTATIGIGSAELGYEHGDPLAALAGVTMTLAHVGPQFLDSVRPGR